jgi:hypothetical protein
MALTAGDKHLADFEKGTEGASCPDHAERHRGLRSKRWDVSSEAARTANQEEHELTVRNVLTFHWKAVMWSLSII